MIDEVVLESILDMSDEEFSEALEALSDDEIDSLCEALEGLSSADKKSIRDFGRGIGSGSIKGSPEQDRNHEAVYNAAMNKVNTFQGKDRDKALKALKKGVKKGIGGNIFTRGKRADALLSNMQSSSNFHKEQDKTRELNNQLQNKINSFNTAKEDVNMFNYDAETIEALEGILGAFAEMDETEIDAVTESLDADELALITQYIDDREDALAVESVIEALIDMDDAEYASAIESFEADELTYLAACEGLVDTIRKVQFKGAGALVGADKVGDKVKDMKNAWHQGMMHGRATGRQGYGDRFNGADEIRKGSDNARKDYGKSLKGKIYDMADSVGNFRQNRRDDIEAAKGKIKDTAQKAKDVLTKDIGYLPGEKKRKANKLKSQLGL